MPKLRFLAALCLFSAALAWSATATADTAATGENPCEGPEAAHLRCPNLKIGPPTDLYLQRTGGRERLRATSDVRSRGKGPMELRGTRSGWHTMHVRQRIYRTGAGHIDLPTRATLHFTDVGPYFGGSYWKVHQLARFELRRVLPDGGLGYAVRSSPKLNYCLRDLERTRPGKRSPSLRHYPGCNQNPYENRVTLGTSVGWSDIYPADYEKQWIDVTGLRGCFDYVMRVDPKNLLFESNEGDNNQGRLVRLPWRGDVGC